MAAGNGAGVPTGSAFGGKRHSSMKHKQLSIKSIGIKAEERISTAAAEAASGASRG